MRNKYLKWIWIWIWRELQVAVKQNCARDEQCTAECAKDGQIISKLFQDVQVTVQLFPEWVGYSGIGLNMSRNIGI